MAHAGDARRVARRRAQPGSGRDRVTILALETSCDDTCAAVVDGDGRVARQRDLLAGGSRRASAAWCRRSPRATTWSWSTWSSAQALARGRRDARRRRAGRRDAGSGAGRRAAGRAVRGQGARRRARAAVRAGRPPAGPRGGQLRSPAAPTATERAAPFEPPFVCLIASGGHTLLARVQRARRLRGARRARSTTPPARRSTRARGCSGSATPAARRSSAWRRRRPAGVRVPGLARRARAWRARRAQARVREGLDFSFAGLKTALLYRLRELSAAEIARARRRPRRLLPGGDRRQPARRAPSGRCAQTGLRPAGGRRRRGRQRRAAPAAARRSGPTCTCRRASCAPTTRR